MSEDMSYQRAVDILSSLVHRRGVPEECRAFLTLLAEIQTLRIRDPRSRSRGVQIGDHGTQTNHF